VSTRQDPTAGWNWTALRAQCLRETQRVLGATVEAEDAAQEAAVRAWQKRHACAVPERPGPWIRTIAQREALRLAGGRKRETALDEAHEPAASDEDLLLLKRSVRAAVADLSPGERRLLLGCYWEDLSGAELSRALGLAEVTVRVQLHRTRARLRDLLEPVVS
jgi:RNA polymerase sigma-70 factor (ECF subfamily)